MNSKNNISKLLGTLIIIFALTFSTNLKAQGRGNTDGDITNNTGVKSTDGIPGNCGHGPNQHAGNACGGGGESVPLDGGLSILLLGGAAFGIKKLRDSKK